MYHFDNSKDLRTEILFVRLGKFRFLLTDSNVLADAISRCLDAHLAPSFLHSLPQREYVGAADIVREYVDVTVRVFVCEIFVQFISYGSLDSFDDQAFDIGVPTDLKLYALALQQLLKRLIKEFFPLSVRTQTGRLLKGYENGGHLASIEKPH